jgi:stage II sporulation protein AA (anti-sigma F factor antagonist)
VNQALSVTTRTDAGGAFILDLSGILDGHTIVVLEPYAETAVASPAKIVVVHLAGVSFMSSAGVGSLIALNHQLRGKGRSLRLAAPSEGVAEVFSILGLSAVIAVHKDLASALVA